MGCGVFRLRVIKDNRQRLVLLTNVLGYCRMGDLAEQNSYLTVD